MNANGRFSQNPFWWVRKGEVSIGKRTEEIWERLMSTLAALQKCEVDKFYSTVGCLINSNAHQRFTDIIKKHFYSPGASVLTKAYPLALFSDKSNLVRRSLFSNTFSWFPKDWKIRSSALCMDEGKIYYFYRLSSVLETLLLAPPASMIQWALRRWEF
jgi:hypothetical protein